MVKTFTQIFKRLQYLTLALAAGILTYATLVIISNIDLLQNTLTRSDFSFGVKTAILSTAFHNSFIVSGITTTLLALLMGVNIAVITYYFKHKISAFRARSSATSIVGIVIGVFGLGCAACGSFIITSLIPFFGLGAIFSFLPFHGEEFGVIGILLLLTSLYLTLREIQNPAICRIAE